MSKVQYRSDVFKYGNLYVSKEFMEAFHIDAGLFDGALRQDVPADGMCLALIDLGSRGKIFGTVSTREFSTNPYVFAPDDEEKLGSLQQVLAGSRKFAFSNFNGQITLQNHTTPVVGRGTLAKRVASVVGIYGVRRYKVERSLPNLVQTCLHPELTRMAIAMAEGDTSFDYQSVCDIFDMSVNPEFYDSEAGPFSPEYDVHLCRNTSGGFNPVVTDAAKKEYFGPMPFKGSPDSAALLKSIAQEHIDAMTRSGWNPTGRFWATQSHPPRVPVGFTNFTGRKRSVSIMSKPGTGTIVVEIGLNTNLCFEVDRMAGPYDVLHVRRGSGPYLESVEPIESHTVGSGMFMYSNYYAPGGVDLPADNRAHDLIVHGYKMRVQRDGLHLQVVAGQTVNLGEDHPLSDAVITPLLGSLGPSEEAFVLRDLHYEAVLVGTGTSPDDPRLGRLVDGSLMRPTMDGHDPTTDPTGEFGFQDVVVLYIDAKAATRYARYDGPALEFIGTGAAVTKSPPAPVVESYRRLGEELEGQPFSVVERATPYRVPFDVVTRTELYVRHKKAREKACKKNNFMSLEYAKGLTWGMANTACNRQLALSRVYAVQWDVPVEDTILEDDLPSKLVFKKLVSSYHVESSEKGGKVTYTAKDAGKVAYFVSRGVPTSGVPMAEVLQAWGFEDVTPDGLAREKTTQEFELARLGGTHSTSGLGGNALSFSHLAYANAGYPDLERMDAQDAYKAVIASVNVYGQVGAQLDKAVTRYRVNIPASVMTRGMKIIKPHLEDVPIPETNEST